MSGGMRCPQCGITGDNMQQHPSIAAWMHCTACGCVTHKKYLGTPTAPEPAAAPQVDLEDARRLADDGLEPFDLRRCTRRLADELDAHRARHAELVALVAEWRAECDATPPMHIVGGTLPPTGQRYVDALARVIEATA